VLRNDEAIFLCTEGSASLTTFVKLKILNMLGQEVRTRVHETQEAGKHFVRWYRRDHSGRMAASSCVLRNENPKEAMKNLAEVLKDFRNRRSHGFEIPSGPRDTEILGAALEILRM
jgi:hypothetical protein